MVQILTDLAEKGQRFQKNKGKNDHLAIAIVSIGHVIDKKQESHVKILKQCGWQASSIKKSSDKSEYLP